MALERGPENLENENPEIKQAEAEKQEQQKIEHNENAEKVEANMVIKGDTDSDAESDPEDGNNLSEVGNIPEDADATGETDDSTANRQDEFFFSEDSPYARFAENAESGIVVNDPDGNDIDNVGGTDENVAEDEPGSIGDDPDTDNLAENKQDEFMFTEDSPYAQFAENSTIEGDSDEGDSELSNDTDETNATDLEDSTTGTEIQDDPDDVTPTTESTDTDVEPSTENTDTTDVKPAADGTDTDVEPSTEDADTTDVKSATEGTDTDVEPSTEGTDTADVKPATEGTDANDVAPTTEGTDNTETEPTQEDTDTSNVENGVGTDKAENKVNEATDSGNEEAETTREREKTKYEQLTNEDKAELLQTPAGREKLNAMYDDMVERKEAKDKGMSVEDYRTFKSGQLDKEYGAVASVYNKATELNSSPELQKTLFTADYEATASELKGKLKEDLKAIEDKMAKFEGKPMEMGEYPEWKKLNSEKEKREEQISDIDKMLTKAKDVERNNAFEQSTERYNAIRGDSKKERREDLKRDQVCVRNNIAAARGIRQDIVDTKKEADKIEAKLTDIANTYSLDDMRTDPRLSGVYKKFKELNHQYGELRDKQETYEKQLNRLDDLNKKLSEIHGVDKEGRPVLEVPDLRKEINDRAVYDAIKAVNESSQGTLLKDKLEAKDCVDALSAIDNAERVVMPALAEQISGLDQQLSAIDSYLANNPPDAYFSDLKEKLGKEYAEKFAQLGELVEGTTRLKTHMEVSDLKHSAKCVINADGTYSLQQRWTNVKEKISDNGTFKNTRQFYSNAYDRVSNCKFDEKGRVLSEDFSFKYKMLGYFSERKFGGEKLNLHNVFETGLLNVKAKGGWDQEKGFNIEGEASVFEIKDAATLNMLNKQVMQLNSNLSFMEAKGKTEFNREKAQMTASFSVNDGWSGGAGLSVGKVKVLDAAFNSFSNSVSGKFDLAQAVDGKLEGIKISGEESNKFSYSIGDKIRLYEYENTNGVVEHSVFTSDITDLFSPDTGFSDVKDVYDSYAEQKETFDDISENGIAKDEVSSQEKVAFQTKQHADEDNKFNRAARDAKDLGERTLNGAATGEQPAWIKEADVIKAMDKTLLSLDDQKLVSETVDKIQKGEPLSKDDANQLEYIHVMLAKNGYSAEARAVSHLYSTSEQAVRDDADNVFAGAMIWQKETSSNRKKIKTAEDGKFFLNTAPEGETTDWVSQDEVNFAMKKSYLASDDMNLVAEAVDKIKRGEAISNDDKDQLNDIAETLSDSSYTREAEAIFWLLRDHV